MGLDDIFGFDANAYATKVRYLTVPELKARELAKTRQVLTSSAAGGASFGAAFATGGLTLVFTALSLRKIDVAKKKLDMVVAELQRRRVPLKENVTRRDKALAIVGGLTGMVAGEAMGNAISGDGAAAVGGGGGGGGDAYFPHVTAEQMAGSAAGAGVQWAMMQFGRRDSWVDMVRGLMGCSRLGGVRPGDIFCDRCSVAIAKGLYAHCCECNDEYDLCFNCYSAEESRRCNDSTHVLQLRQICTFGPSEPSVFLRYLTDMTGRKGCACGSCGREMGQGRVYYCETCTKDGKGFSLCPDCYASGVSCPLGHHHCLRVFLNAAVDEANDMIYETTYGSATAGCNHCSSNIRQGAIYQCKDPYCASADGHFDMCYQCYSKGKTCHGPSHQLTMYFAYETTETWQSIYTADDVTCDVCCNKVTDAVCYHCKKCNNNNYDVCRACYMTRMGCHSEHHKLTKMRLTI